MYGYAAYIKLTNVSWICCEIEYRLPLGSDSPLVGPVNFTVRSAHKTVFSTDNTSLSS